MCGICGFVNYQDKELIERMTAILGHRGPDGQGVFVSPKVSFGHRRLSIIDLSESGSQPMFNEDKEIVLIFNGEIFNFQEIRQELIKQGHKFTSKSDTEVVIHGYESFGIEKIVQKLRGFFAFALWDVKKEKLFLVRDRIGVKPLYYYQDKEKIFFASEIKAILENKQIERKVNLDSFHSFLAFQTSLGEGTMFKDIKKVPPATIISFEKGKLDFKKYWQIRKDESVEKLNQKEKEERMRFLVEDSVRSRLIADVPVGALLSGGLDSSSIVAIMSKFSDKPIKTFSVGFGEPDDELGYARIVAEKYKTEHQELIIRPNKMPDLLPKIIWHQDEPLADGGGIATFLAAKEVSKYVKVVLVGEGGDELFGGYSWYRLGLPLLKIVPEKLKKEIYFYLTTFNREKLPFKNLPGSKKDDFLSKMIKFEIENILPNSLCMKVDKMTSAWGLEAREPFLDCELAQFCFSLSSIDKVSLGGGKALFKKIMGDVLPKEILGRKKHGFLLPTNRWLDGDLKKYSQEILFDKNNYSSNYYSRSEIENLYVKRKYFAEIERINLLWRLLIFELWYKIYCR